MISFCIIETDNGMTVVERPQGMSGQEVAERHGGVIVDSGPYDNYEDAIEVLEALQLELDDEDLSDVPGTQPLEDRWEDAD